ncbi:OmpL47-type beta-barrel domain-containing protein [Paenibacillus arenilitoris]|uniref:Streptogramin lyase n=1 Tax=Paenibacillus arenilitoris TaxID=2772299 RepID=A0A927CNV1_9BACL|nr:hypothetical protein [Paenibacillus arenilitoris]MBD2870038.1 hypothetical protein [Paenibacillus arenilitoris]
MHLKWMPFKKQLIILTITLFGLSSLQLQSAEAKSPIDKHFGEPVSVGAPIQQIAIFESAYGQEDGRDVMYTTVNGKPAMLNVIDLADNKLLRTFPLPDADSSWAKTVAADGTLYIAGQSKMYRYSPQTKELDDLGQAIPGETSIWGLVADENGNVYGGTYPNAKVFKFDPQTKLFTDYGTMVEGQGYVRSIAYADGIVYAGIGTVGHIVKLDPVTGDKSELPIRDVPVISSLPFVYGLDVRGDYLFAYLNGNGTTALLIYDRARGVWLDEVYHGYGGLDVSPEREGKVYFVQNRKVQAFDMTMRQVTDTGIAYGTGFRSTGWVRFPDNPELPGETLVTIQFGGKTALFNFESGVHKTLPAVAEGQPTLIQALEKGPDGKIYTSGMTSALGGAFDPVTRTHSTYPMGQAESIGAFGNDVYFGIYPKAEIRKLDTTLPVQTDPNKPNPNPVSLFYMEEDQDRPYVQTTGGGKIYFGTIPYYGKLGGALVAYDPASNAYDVHRHVVHNQSIVGLAYRDGKIYGSTSIRGGLGIDPTESEAKMFVWDAVSGEKLSEFTPEIPGAAKSPIMISGLTFDKDGLLWAAADGILFAVDPDTQQVVKSKIIYPGVTDYGMWRPIHLRWGEDGLLYTDLHGQLTILDPETMEHKELGIKTALFTLGDDGNIYYAQETRMYRIPVSDAGEEDAEPPVTEIALMPEQPDGKNEWYVSPITFTLSAHDEGSGLETTQYSWDEGENWITYDGSPLQVLENGRHALTYRSIDKAGNEEAPHTIRLHVDREGPAIKWKSEIPEEIGTADELKLAFELQDEWSGADSDSIAITLDEKRVDHGSALPLFHLPLGEHTLTIRATDLAGNESVHEANFKLVTSFDSLKQLVYRFAELGWIDNHGIAKSLAAKVAKGKIEAFIKQVRAQTGKHISKEAAAYLIRDAEALR